MNRPGKHLENIREDKDRDLGNLALIAAQAMNTPLALILLRHDSANIPTAAFGIKVTELPEKSVLYDFSARQAELAIIEDTLEDPLFRKDALVLNAPGIRSLSLAPIFSDSENNQEPPIGALCVLDVKTRTFTQAQKQTLGAIATQVSHSLALHTKLDLLNNERKRLNEINYAINQAAIVGITDKDGQITFANEKFCKISGYSQEELLGQNHRILKSGVHPKEFYQELWGTIAAGKMWSGEVCNKQKNGQLYWMNANVFPLPQEEGEEVRYAAVRFDITDRKLLEDKLRVAKEAETRASNSKSEFLANMSHEIRTPMNGIIGMVDLLMESPLSPEQREFAKTISTSGRTLVAIINDILDFSKIEAGKMNLEAVEFDVLSFLKELLIPFQLSAEKKGISLHLEAPLAAPSILGDSGRFGQIVNNLVGNAIKFTNGGGVHISLKFFPKLSHNTPTTTGLALTIRDTGVGIPKHVQANLFQSFTQAESSTTRQFGGTGLGLAIAKRLVELMGGSIALTSEVGVGTTLTVNIEFKTGEKILSSSLLKQAPKPSYSKLQGRILVAEDNPVNQKVIAAMLEKLGIYCLLVSNGIEVISALSKSEFDLVLMDCQMPERDGYEASQSIRKMQAPSFQNIPIVALTANAIQGDQEKCLAAGMTDYLAKPVTLSQLHKVLEKYLGAISPKAKSKLF
ncbi:ATP-binding protein [Bdellovibrionota bacterium FG-2]